ncbi:hypothetical protein HMPREF3038_01687 [Akkermansia sp. KLE1797]|nr:hypothetical protein HMPREF3038_01687 [Akkermansia sp. KLE1797]KXU53890.1 hypothetical protein HMPREF3039_01845 [Akkermansia sp. KLE1798]
MRSVNGALLPVKKPDFRLHAFCRSFPPEEWKKTPFFRATR